LRKRLFIQLTLSFILYSGLYGNPPDSTPENNLELKNTENMVVDHLYRIYQKPPPLAKEWPPSSLEEWKQQRLYYQKAIQEMLNLPPDNKKKQWPLNLRITKPDLDTTNVTIKYLVYQSRPNFWVTANLYIPKDIRLPAPTIMVLHGHSKGGKATKKYQLLVHNLVKKGYIVFFKDGIGLGERAYTGHNYMKMGPFTYMSGISVDGLETWDNIRAVDLLYSGELSQWVDEDKIGVIGMSGGSMQAFNLILVDKRIKADAQVCRSNTFTAEFKLWGHCICCVCASGIRRTAEQYHMLATAAPRPVLICSGTTDKNHPLEGAQDLVRETKKIYALYKAEENLRLVVDDGGHKLSAKFRKEIYNFFNEHFNVKADTSEDTVITLTRKQLDCGLPKKSTATIPSIVYETAHDLPMNKGVYHQVENFEKYKKNLIAALKKDIFGYQAYMPEPCALNPSVIDKKDRGNFIEETVSYQSETDIPLFATLSYPKGLSKAPVIINIAGDKGNLNEFIDAGYSVLSVDLRPNDGYSRRYGENWGVWARGMSCGKPSTGMRIYDVLRSIDYLVTRSDIIDATRIGCLGTDTMNSMYAMYAAALDYRIKAIIIEEPVTTYKPETDEVSSWYEWDLDMFIPNILLYADVSQVASLIAPRPLWVIGGRNIGNRHLTALESRENLYSCVHTYNLLNESDKLKFDHPKENKELIKWFNKCFAYKKDAIFHNH